MRLIKYGSGSCGPCGRMSHYDYKVADELGLPFTYIKKNTDEYKTQDHIVSQLRSVPNPTYVLVDDEDKVLGHFSGASDKGKFRERVKELLPGKTSPTFVATPYQGDCPQGTVSIQWDSKNQVYNVVYNQEWIQDIAIINPSDDESRHLVIQFKPNSCIPSCSNLGLCSDYTANGDKIESIVEWECDADYAKRRLTIKVKAIVETDATITRDEPVVLGGEPSCSKPAHGSCPDPGSNSSDQFHWEVNPSDLVIDTCKEDGFKLPFRTGSCDASEGQTCNDGLGGKNIEYTPYFQKADGSWIQGKTVGGSGHTFEIPDELEAPGTYKCVALAVCLNSHREKIRAGERSKTCCGKSCIKSNQWDLVLKKPDECGEGPVDPPDPPDDPCKDVVCPECHTCVDGNCVSLCGPDQLCENGVCVDPPPPERYIYPSCFYYECCPDCPSLPPGFEEGDNGDCDGRPTPDPVPGADDRNKVYLYDRLNHTFVFCCPIQTDVTWLMRFDTIPPVFQRYITTAAAVRAAAQMVDNPQLFQLLKDREQVLRMACTNYELEQGDLNYLGQPDYTTYVGYQPIQTLNR